MWLLLAIVCLVIGLLIGWGQGRNGQGAKERLKIELSKAWQEGFDAATTDANRRIPPGLWPPGAPAQPPARVQHGVARPIGAQPFHGAAENMGPVAGGPPMPPPPVMVPSPPAPVRPALSPEQRTLRNINITLYAAALMVVAASSLVIGLVLPAVVKVVGLGLLSVAFYAGGLLMHAKSTRLRPAAVAFTGTGLALIPITALAHYTLLGSHSGLSWFVGSLVGTAAFAFACARLNSRVLAALSTVFLVSTAWSGGAVLNRGLIWYFIFSMVAASALTLLAARRPRWLDNIYVASFTTAHRFLVPATVAAALLSFHVLSAADYAWVFTAAAGYYTVAFFQSAPSERRLHLLAVRACSGLALGALLVHLGVGNETTFRILACFVLAQQLVVFGYRGRYTKMAGLDQAKLVVETWIVLGLAAVLVVAGGERRMAGEPLEWVAGDLNWSIVALLLVSACATRILGAGLRWAPLLAALPVLVEPAYGVPGRQGVVLLAALLLAYWAVRPLDPAVRGQISAAMRCLMPFTAAAMLGWMAAGASFAPEGIGSQGLHVEGIVLQASAVGFIVVAIVQVLVSAARLNPYRVAGPGVPTPGEAWFLPGGTVAAAAVLWLLSNGRAASAANGLPVPEWLGAPWALLMAVVLLVAVLGAATVVLGTHWQERGQPQNGSSPMGGAGARRSPVRTRRYAAHLTGLLGIGLILPVFMRLEPDWLLIAGSSVALAYAGVRLLAPGSPWVRGSYAILAQLLFTASALRLAGMWDADQHARTALAAFTLAAAQSVRIWFGQRSPAGSGIGLRKEMGWATQVLLLLFPLAYALVAGAHADQAALLVQGLCLGGFSLVWWLRGDQAPHAGFHRNSVLGVGLGVLILVVAPVWGPGLRDGGWLPLPLWGPAVAALICAALAGALIKAESADIGGVAYRGLRALFVAVFVGMVLGLQLGGSARWILLAFLLGAVAFLVFSATTGLALLVSGTVLAAVPASLGAIGWWHEAGQTQWREPADTISGLVAAAVVLLLAAIAGGRFRAPLMLLADIGPRHPGWSNAHARVLHLGSLLILGTGGIIGAVGTGPWAYVGCALLVATAAVTARTEVPLSVRETGWEAAVLVTAASTQRAWAVYRDGIEFFWATQYWVVVLALLAGYEFLRRRGDRGAVLLVASAGILSLGALAGWTPGRQLWVLIAFTALLAAGLLVNRRLFVIWGAVGSGLMVLWFLRGYTFLLLFVLAGGLIAVALWRLARMGSRQRQQPTSGHADPLPEVRSPTGPPPPPAE